MRGSQGHAGTVPMSMRQDAMAAAAELIVLLESVCKNPKDFLSYDGHCNDISLESLSSSLVCTVGEISTWPSASNVIPGQVRTFTYDYADLDNKAQIGIPCCLLIMSEFTMDLLEKGDIHCGFTSNG